MTETQIKCPTCEGPADNGHDRCIPPNPYLCTKCDIDHEWQAMKGDDYIEADKMTDTPNELKPCPFCGSRPFAAYASYGYLDIICGNNDCKMRPVKCGEVKKAKKAWNTRAALEVKAVDVPATKQEFHKWMNEDGVLDMRDPLIQGGFLAINFLLENGYLHKPDHADLLRGLLKDAVDTFMDCRQYQICDELDVIMAPIVGRINAALGGK